MPIIKFRVSEEFAKVINFYAFKHQISRSSAIRFLLNSQLRDVFGEYDNFEFYNRIKREMKVVSDDKR
jgi:hypothetical protein